jgi:hypothetical protein
MADSVEQDRAVAGDRFRLRASPDASGVSWTARIVGHSEGAHSKPFERPIPTPKGVARAAFELMGKVDATGPTAEAAIDRLADELATTITEATRVDLDAINRARAKQRPRPPWV